ncbi:MAG TPA: hypothetical protein VIY48_12260 [Candidatus Paceibacterota bacterium]
MAESVVRRLQVLEHKLEAEGHYVGANTAWMAREYIIEMLHEISTLANDEFLKTDPNANYRARASLARLRTIHGGDDVKVG